MAITKENKQVEVFDQYLRNQMDASARAAFESQLDHDGSLRRQLEQYRILMNALRKVNDAEFRTHFRDYSATLETQDNFGAMLGVGLRFAIVGVVSLLLFIALLATAFLM